MDLHRVLVLAVLIVASQGWGAASFTRYAVILDRRPFGEIVPDAAMANRAAVPAVPPFVKDYKMCAITEDEAGIQVGVINIKLKKNYFMGVGDPPQDGLRVLDADYAKERALLSKDGQEHWITMDGPVMASLAPAPRPQPATASRAEPTTAAVNASIDKSRLSYAERLRRRREAIRTREVAKPALEGKDLEAHLQRYQMELIRKGQPALPIPLTPEMDKKLVEEGVLPPMEEFEPQD